MNGNVENRKCHVLSLSLRLLHGSFHQNVPFFFVFLSFFMFVLQIVYSTLLRFTRQLRRFKKLHKSKKIVMQKIQVLWGIMYFGFKACRQSEIIWNAL